MPMQAPHASEVCTGRKQRQSKQQPHLPAAQSCQSRQRLWTPALEVGLVGGALREENLFENLHQ